jgi:integrase/recombinase XerC
MLPAPADRIENALAPATGGTLWNDVAEAYLTNASRSGSENTQRAYRRHLRAFAAAPLEVGEHRLPPIRTLSDVSPAHLMAWRAYVMGLEGLSAGSRAQAIAAIRGFMRWAGSQGLHVVPSDQWREALRMPPGEPARPFSVLTDAEVVRLFEAVETATTAKGKPRSRERRDRDTAILAVMLGAGLRAAEVVALEVRDVTAGEGGTVLAVKGKGGKPRPVPIREDVAAPVLRYLHTTGRRLGDSGALFLREGDRSGRHLTTRTVGMVTAEYAAEAGIEAARAFSPHACRHTYAVRAAREGAGVHALKRLLGHSSVATTGRYLDHLSLADLREALPALPTRETLR